MAKRTRNSKFKGELNVDQMQIVEIGKDFEVPYDLLAELHEYNGKVVTLTIAEEQEVPPATEE